MRTLDLHAPPTNATSPVGQAFSLWSHIPPPRALPRSWVGSPGWQPGLVSEGPGAVQGEPGPSVIR